MPSRIAAACLAGAVLVPWMIACDARGRRGSRAVVRDDFEPAAPYQAEVDEGLGAAVAILVDTSGSMRDEAPGDSRPKYIVAREALEAMLDATDAFVAKRPDFPIKVGLYSFSSSPTRILPLQAYDRAVVHDAFTRLPRPGGGTAIGDAMRAARPDLYRAGVFRKYLLIVTDGENTTGRSPDAVAREIFRKSEGGVRIAFVAFDTDPEKFDFLKDIGGDIVGAGNSPQLHAALNDIYQGKILAEATGLGEREPAQK
jgi:Mg-chelatase subunit ChlD